MTGEEKLAEAMVRLADKMEEIMDPLVWQRIFANALQSGLLMTLPTPPTPLPGVAGMIVGATVQVQLSDEERENLAARLHEALQPQVAEFNEFVKESLKEMPPSRLKAAIEQLVAEFNEFVKESLKEMPPARLKAAIEQLEQGKQPQLRRRRGCIFLDFGNDNEFYLPLLGKIGGVKMPKEKKGR